MNKEPSSLVSCNYRTLELKGMLFFWLGFQIQRRVSKVEAMSGRYTVILSKLDPL
jgi:hypothetical protein